jgi:hypothetical protein
MKKDIVDYPYKRINVKELFPNFVIVSRIFSGIYHAKGGPSRNTKLYIPYYNTKIEKYSYVTTTFSRIDGHKRKTIIWKILEVEKDRIIHEIKSNERLLEFKFRVPSTPTYYLNRLDLIKHIMSKSVEAEVLKVPEELAIEI